MAGYTSYSQSIFPPLSTGTIDQELNRLLGQGGGLVSGTNMDENRNAFTFSSRLRFTHFNADQDRMTELRDAQEYAKTLSASSNVSQPSTAARIEDLTGQLNKAFPVISMIINPHNVKFTQPKRFTAQKTQSGTVHHHFSDEKGQNNDILTISMQGNTGNIMNLGSTKEERDRAMQRLKTWHELYQLTREPMWFVDSKGFRTRNEFYITYSSPLIPLPVQFMGFFAKVLDFDESAEKPFSKDYSFEFIVEGGDDFNALSASLEQLNYATPGQ